MLPTLLCLDINSLLTIQSQIPQQQQKKNKKRITKVKKIKLTFGLIETFFTIPFTCYGECSLSSPLIFFPAAHSHVNKLVCVFLLCVLLARS